MSALRGSLIGFAIIGLAVYGLASCGDDRACAQPVTRSSPSPALGTTGPKPKTPLATPTKSAKQHPKTWGAYGRHNDDDDCDDD